MSKAPSLTEFTQRRTVESLHKALDQLYHNLVEAAKADWEQLFAENDPSDGCVTVRVSKEQMADELASIPRAGALPIKKPAKRTNGRLRRRMA